MTSSRADYGLLRWTMQHLQDNPGSELLVIATGTHLSELFGHTIDAIRADGFSVAAEIAMNVDTGDGFSAALAASQVLRGMAEALQRLTPDILLVLGDRYEILAAAQAAFLARVPIAHIHGGEVTAGALDDSIRHAITKLARLHLTSTADHRRRVLQLGEDPAWVRVVGAPGLENLKKLPVDDQRAFETRVGLRLGDPVVLLTYHPATAANEDPRSSMETIVTALEPFSTATIIATGSNADPGAREAMDVLRNAAAVFAGRMVIHESLGVRGYLSALRHCDVVLGNSSSGIIEAPSAGIPTVNVGNRQRGRPRAPSVIDCEVDARSIQAAIVRSQSPEFRALAARRENPYASAGTDIGELIVKTLLSVDIDSLRSAKPFVDIGFCSESPT